MSERRRTAALGVIALSLAIAYGIWYSYSVILVALLAEFGWSRSVLAGAFSVFTLVHGGVNPLIGMLCARFRPLRVIAVGGAATPPRGENRASLGRAWVIVPIRRPPTADRRLICHRRRPPP